MAVADDPLGRIDVIYRLTYYGVTLALIVALGSALECRAYAYVDPGSSLLFFQSVSAVITGGLFYFRRRLKTLFTRTKPDPPGTTHN